MICSKCKIDKNLDNFSIRADTGKYRKQCIVCRKKYLKGYLAKNKKHISIKNKERRELNIEKALERERKSREKNKFQRQEYNRQYREKNKDKINEYARAYREKNKSEISQKRKIKYYENNTEYLNRQRNLYYKNHKKYRDTKNKYYNTRINKDICFKLSKRIRSRLSIIMKDICSCKFKKSKLDFIGCSILELKEYLESKFEPGMTWENYGLHGWHIDHIMPLSSFNLLDEKELKIASHYTNLQPLWAADNLKKSNKLCCYV